MDLVQATDAHGLNLPVLAIDFPGNKRRFLATARSMTPDFGNDLLNEFVRSPCCIFLRVLLGTAAIARVDLIAVLCTSALLHEPA